MTQISEEFQLVLQEQVFLVVPIHGKFSKLHPLPPLIGRHINHSWLFANLLTQVGIVNTVLLHERKYMIKLVFGEVN